MAMRDMIPWRKRRCRPETVDVDIPGRSEMQDFFRDALDDFFGSAWGLAPWMRKGLAFGPAVDISETNKEFSVEVELPGLKKEDLDVTIDNGRLHIAGERQVMDKEEKKNYVRTERSYGSFSRTIQLPPSIQEDGAEADYKDGVLTVRIPKSPEAQGKKIDIKD